jgi:molecular chaperone DnaK
LRRWSITSVDEALRDAELTIHQIDDLVLVGGSTRIPLVQRRLREEFLREPSRAVDPDLAVAMGAAVQAAMIDGQSVGPVLVDVTGHTLGIEACEGMFFTGPSLVFSPIIHRNSPLPARYEHVYSTMYDEQKRAEIHVLQGEHSEVHRNRSIGKFMLDLETGGGDRSKIAVRFDLTLDGTLNVTATQPATGVSKELKIDNALSQFQADERDRAQARLGAMFDASDELIGDEDLPSKKQFEVHGENESLLQSKSIANEFAAATSKFPAAVALLEKADDLESSVDEEDVEDIQTLTENLKQAMASDDQTAVTSLSEELDDILFYVQ